MIANSEVLKIILKSPLVNQFPVIKKVDYLINVYKGGYIIIRDDEKETLQPFIATNKFKKIASLTIPEGYQTSWQKNRNKFGLSAATFYNGSIYKRITE